MATVLRLTLGSRLCGAGSVFSCGAFLKKIWAFLDNDWAISLTGKNLALFYGAWLSFLLYELSYGV